MLDILINAEFLSLKKKLITLNKKGGSLSPGLNCHKKSTNVIMVSTVIFSTALDIGGGLRFYNVIHERKVDSI